MAPSFTCRSPDAAGAQPDSLIEAPPNLEIGDNPDLPAWFATAIAGVLLIQGSAGTPFWKDAGELSASAIDLGIAHPTGFSSWGALARVFSLIPMGTIHLRVALASAIPMALCIGLIAHIIRPSRGRNTITDFGIRSLALPALALSSPTLWYLGTTPEVYALATLLALSWLVIFSNTREPQKFKQGAVLLGLTPGVHITAVFGALAICTRKLVGQFWAFIKRQSSAGLTLCLFALASSGVFALNLVAARNPELNFDNPTGLSGLWRHLSAQGIQERFSAPGTRPGFGETVDLHMAFISQDLGLVVLAFGIFATFLWQKSPGTRSLALLVAIDLLYNIFINPMGRRDLQTGILTVLGTTGLSLIGVRAAAGYLPRYKSAAVLCASLLVIFSRTDSVIDDLDARQALRRDSVPLKLTRASLAPLAPNSLVFTSSDDAIGLLYAARRVEGRRPDIRHLLSSFAWWPWHLEKQGLSALSPEAAPSNENDQIINLKKILRNEAPLRMIAWEPGAGALDSVVGTWLQAGLLVGAIQKTHPTPARWQDPSTQAQKILAPNGFPTHPWSKRVVSESLRLNAVNAARKQDTVAALRWAKDATKIDPKNGRAWNNLGVILMKNEDKIDALNAMNRATELRPRDSRVWRNLGLALLQNNKASAAQNAFKNAEKNAQSPQDLARAQELRRQSLSGTSAP